MPGQYKYYSGTGSKQEIQLSCTFSVAHKQEVKTKVWIKMKT